MGAIASRTTWSPQACKIMAFMAITGGLGLLFLHTFGVQVDVVFRQLLVSYAAFKARRTDSQAAGRIPT